MTKVFLLIVCPLLVSFSAQAAKTVAVVGSKKISLKDFNTRYKEVQLQSLNPPSKELFLEDLIRFEIGVQEAKKRKLSKNPIVQNRIDQELYKALVEFELKAKVEKIKVTEGEMKKWYRKNPELRTSHILIQFKENATKKEKEIARKRALEIYKEVKKSKRPFEELVNLYTDDSISKASGGDIGWQSRLTVVPEYYETALKMRKNQIKGLISTPFGFHIIKLTGRRKYAEANKRQIRAGVFNEKRRVVFNGFFKNLKKKYAVKINKNVIK